MTTTKATKQTKARQAKKEEAAARTVYGDSQVKPEPRKKQTMIKLLTELRAGPVPEKLNTWATPLLRELSGKGLAQPDQEGVWTLTHQGLQAALAAEFRGVLP